MQKSQLRAPLTAVATVLFLVALSFDPTPSDSKTSDIHQYPVRDAAAEAQDLAGFFLAGSGGASAAGDGRFHAFRPGDLDAVEVRPAAAPRKLSLFDDDASPDVEAQRRFLHEMPYGAAISVASRRHRVDGLLVAAIVSVESGFSPAAVSPKGAQGLMQVRPAVGAAFGVSDLTDPNANVDVGSRYLRGLLKDYRGDMELALAAYNAGPAAVARYGGVPPYRETRAYVRKVLNRYEEYNRRARRQQQAG